MQLDAVPAAVPAGIEEILEALAGQPGVEAVTLGRTVEEKRTVSQVGEPVLAGLHRGPERDGLHASLTACRSARTPAGGSQSGKACGRGALVRGLPHVPGGRPWPRGAPWQCRAPSHRGTLCSATR